MKYKDYDPKNPPLFTFPNTEESMYPILKAFAPNYDYDQLYKLNAIYAWSENLLENLRKQDVCQVGCFHCCAQKVAVSPIEIINIKNHLGDFIPRDNGMYCPLLDIDEGKCGIYPFRPLVCRTMLTFDDPKYCESNTKHYIYNSPQHHTAMHKILSNLGPIGTRLFQDITKVLEGKESDLREVFNSK